MVRQGIVTRLYKGMSLMHKYKVAVIAVAGCLASVACEPVEVASDKNEPPKAPPTIEEITPTEESSAVTELNAQFIFDVRNGVVPRLQANSPLSVEAQESGSVIISGSAPTATAIGRTQGAFFTIEPENEEQLSGKRIAIKFLARSMDAETPSAKIAYSTAEVGNSGWREFGLTNEYAEYSFEYSVPLMKEGKRDFIGIVPVSGSVELLAVGIDIL